MAIQTPQTTRTRPEIRGPEKETSIIDRVTILVNHVARSDEYASLRRANTPHTEAFTQAVDTILVSPESNFNDRDAALLRTSSHLGVFMEAQEELAALDEQRSEYGRLSQDDFDRTKELKREYVIPFNHSLKSLVDEMPNASMDDLTRALTRTYTAVFGRYNALQPGEIKQPQDIISQNEVAYRLKQAMNGMRHEIAAESMLTAAGIEYDYDVSIDEDAHGIDIIVYLDGKREPIDIKASLTGETRATEKYRGSRAVWTELGREDFRGMKGDGDNTLSIPFETAQYHADSFVDRVRSVIERSDAHKASVARRMARSARH